VTSMKITPAIDLAMRGGDNPDSEINDLEQQIAQGALQRFEMNPVFSEKGLRWTYNWTHFNSLWMSKDQKIIDLLYRKAPFPQYLEVETTTTCNLRCRICEHTYWNEPNEHMTFDRFKYVVDQFPDLKWIGLTGIGESWTNPDFEKILRYVKSKGIYVELYDSFYYTDEEKARLQVELGVEKIFVSLDAATKETYEKIRVGSNWELVTENVKKLDKWKKRLHKYFPELCFHFIVTKDNLHEAVDYLDMIRDLGVDVHFAQYTRMLHDFPEVHDQFVEIEDEVQQNIIKRGQELGIQVGWNATVPQIKPSGSTCLAWWMPFVFCDGTVIPCCALNEQNDREWQRATSLGNVFEKPFREIWWGDEYTEMRRALYAGEPPRNCERCSIYEVKQ